MTSDPYAPTPYTGPPRPTNVLAIISLIASCIGFTVPGIIMGHIALHEIKQTGEQGRGLALAGLIVGYCFLGIFLVLAAIYVLILIGVLVWGVASSATPGSLG